MYETIKKLIEPMVKAGLGREVIVKKVKKMNRYYNPVVVRIAYMAVADGERKLTPKTP